ncbi:MAG: M1 family metallopeptidase [Pyrinomonadaceae bacterium]
MLTPHKSSTQLKRCLSGTFLCLLICLSASGARHERLIKSWRPVHYDVALTFDDKLSALTRAETKITIIVLRAPLRVVDLDFGALPVDGVLVGADAARFEQRAGQLNVTLPRPALAEERLTLSITYHGRPADGLILTNDKDGHPAATGDNWPDRVHNWIPTLDHPSAKATVNFSVTAPARDLVVANGRLTGKATNESGWQTWTYSEGAPVPPYCMIVAVGEFAEVVPTQLLTEGAPPTPLAYYVSPSEQSLALTGFGAAPLALKFFSQTVAPYPYEKLAHIVGATRYGGMENTSAIVYASSLLEPNPNAPTDEHFHIRRAVVEVVAHETAHQWFGDAVTPATWADLWLSEGFATYFAGLFVEHEEGAVLFRKYMQRQAETYLTYERKRRAPIYDTETVKLNDLLNANNYQKGAWVLHMLRAQLGDAAFFAGLKRYYHAHAGATATTEDLRGALEQTSGQSLREFFARWVYASGHPRYELTWGWRRRARRGGRLTLTLRQTQADAPFLTPVPIKIVSGNRAQQVTLRPVDRITIANYNLAERPTDVLLDPDETLLKEARVTAQ